ncbi:MAG TPA: LamG domain-containing protein [Candidatus Krumholzibacteria bacterium]|nr:LamG domain-containing protein [Candidatus Krumholzibacteria bacterium]
MNRSHLLPLLALILLATAAAAQPSLLAHYTLDDTMADALGITGDAVSGNIVYEEGGVYINGLYPGDTGDAAWYETPDIVALDYAGFSFSVEFMIAAAPGIARPVVMGGGAYRWLGVDIDPDGVPFLTYLSGHHGPVASGPVTPGEWHTAAVTYDGTSATLIIDGVVAGSQAVDLSPEWVNGGRKGFTCLDSGTGRNFLGHLRNLRVYDGVEQTLPQEAVSMGTVKRLYR